MKKYDIILTSGGFDPVHTGHLDMFEAAAMLGTRHYVIINSDEWLMRKKGRVFMPEGDRMRIVKALRPVHSVELDPGEDDDVVYTLRIFRSVFPTARIAFANGGDRGKTNTPESIWCAEHDVVCLYNIGGGKTRASSDLLEKYNASI